MKKNDAYCNSSISYCPETIDAVTDTFKWKMLNYLILFALHYALNSLRKYVRT